MSVSNDPFFATVSATKVVTSNIVTNAVLIPETATRPYPVSPVGGQLWVQNTNPNKLIFTNDVGTDVDLTTTGTVTQVNSGAGLTGGPITTVGTLSLTNTGVVAGAYGGSEQVGTFTVDINGRLTVALNTNILAFRKARIQGNGAGVDSVASGANALAFGDSSQATAADAVCFGRLSTSAVPNSLCAGVSTKARQALFVVAGGETPVMYTTVTSDMRSYTCRVDATVASGAYAFRFPIVVSETVMANGYISAVEKIPSTAVRYGEQSSRYMFYNDSGVVSHIGVGIDQVITSNSGTASVFATPYAGGIEYSFTNSNVVGAVTTWHVVVNLYGGYAEL